MSGPGNGVPNEEGSNYWSTNPRPGENETEAAGLLGLGGSANVKDYQPAEEYQPPPGRIGDAEEAGAPANDSKRSLGSESEFKADSEGAQSTVIEVKLLPEDTYALLATAPFGRSSFCFAFFVCFTQVVSWFFLIDNFIDLDDDKNPLGVPADVEFHVRLVGFLGILVAVFSQDDIVQSFNCMYNGYQKQPFLDTFGERRFQFARWSISLVLRVGQGGMGLVTVLLIVVRASNVVDMLLSFAAGEFISFIDDVAFSLMKYGYSGPKAKSDTHRIQDATFVPEKRFVCGRRIDRFPRTIVIMSLVSIVVSFWGYLTWLQMNGKFMCDSLYIQFSDEVRPELAYFFGFYDKNTSKKRDGKVTYWERRAVNMNTGEPSFFRFCGKDKIWVLTIATGKDDECDKYFAKTDSVEENALYDFELAATDSSWSVADIEWSRDLPVDKFTISCSEGGDFPLAESNFPNPCVTIQLNELYSGFSGSRPWPSTYKMLTHNSKNVLVYERPVFVSETSREGATDIIMYLGVRWALTSTVLLPDFEGSNDLSSLSIYLEKNFHAYTSNYSLAFLSQNVYISSTADNPTPIGLNWYQATQKQVGEKQFQRENSNIDSKAVFICQICSDKNVCFFGGNCTSAGTCDCINGGSGTLCQRSPDADGHCDSYFNTPEFNFDGGDCCSETCVSNAYKCGKDKTGYLEVGYDICHLDRRDAKCPDCWKKSGLDAFGDTNSALSGTSVSIASRGRVLGVGDPGINTVRILDKNGSGWKLRGSLLTGAQNSGFGSVVTIAGPDKAVRNPNKEIPITVAAGGRGNFKVYEWDDFSLEWKDISPTVALNLMEKDIPRLGLYKNGYVFGAVMGNKLHLWERDMFAGVYPGKEIWAKKEVAGAISDFSMSENGHILFIAMKDQSVTKVIKLEDMSETVVKTSNLALAIQSSSTGDFFAILVNYMKNTGEIWIFHNSSGQYDTSFFKNKSIRGIPLHPNQTPMIGFTDDGLTVSVSYPNMGLIHTFSWNSVDSIWKEAGQPLTGSSLSILNDGSAIAVGEEGNDETGPDRGKTAFYKRQDKNSCPSNSTKYHITVSLDGEPTETLWQFQTSQGGASMLQEGPYINKEISVSDEVCIPKETCMNVVLFDTRGDGMRSPGFVGISGLGKDRFNSSGIFGFERIIEIPGVKPCTRIDKPWTEMSLHKRCRDKPCDWNQKGLDLDGKKEFDGSGKTISLSANGKRIAIGAEFHDGEFHNITSAGHVRIFDYDEAKKQWEQVGQDIHGNQRFEFFGYFVSLSADGSTLGVGAPQNNQTGFDTGAARVYRYDLQTKLWNKIGDDLIGKGQFDRFGESISVSDNGSVVIVGAIKNDDNGKDSGHARVFTYNMQTKIWDQRGNDIAGEAAKDFAGIFVDVSGDGGIVAVGADFNDGSEIQSGHVRVYVYVSNSNEWKKLGQDIDGEAGGDLFGSALSLSMDGKTIAVGATVNRGNGDNSGHVRVLKYDGSKNVWVQKGQDIDGEAIGDNSGVSVSLSRNGNIVAVGAKRNDGSAVDSGHARVYQYVARINMWHQIGYDIDGVAKGDFFGRSVSLSGDGDIVAVGSPDHDDVKGTSFGHVRVFEFQPIVIDSSVDLGDPVCDPDQTPFRLEFAMDLFPEDITWGIFNEKGNQIVFENFAESKKKYKSGERVTRRECLQKNVLVAFLISDEYGDGLCCNWGKGSFAVNYGGSLISDSLDFQDVRALCLPQSQQYTPVSIDLTLDNSPVQTWWILHDSTNKTELARSQTNYQGYDPYSSIKQALCARVDHCLTYIIGDNNVDDKGFNGLGIGAGYALSLGGQYLKPKTGDFEATDIVRFGNSCNIPDGKSLVQIVFYAGFLARDVSWQLTSMDNSKASILLDSGNYNVTFSGHFYETMVPSDSCLTFRMHGGSDASFTIRWNGNITHHEHRGFNPLSIVRFGSCSSCNEGTKLAQVLMHKKDESTREALWQITDSSGNSLADGGDYKEYMEVFYDEVCASSSDCLSLNIKGQDDVLYELIWDGKLVKYDTPISDVSVKFGTCNSCPDGQSLFQLVLNTGWQPAKLAWKVVTKAGATIFNKKENSYGQTYQFKHEYHERCMPSDDCLNVTIDDLCAEACLKYRILWNETLVEEGGTSFEKKPFLRVGGNCT